MENKTTVFTTIGCVDNSSRDLNDTETVVHNRNPLAYAHFVIGTFTLVSNSLVILAVHRFHYLRTRDNMYIVSLASIDCCVGALEWVVGLHNHSILSAWFDRTGPACVGMFSFAFFSIACSIFNMVLIALDRLLYITKPFYYRCVVKPKKVKMAIGIVWLLAILWGTVPLYTNTYDDGNTHCTVQAAIPTWYRAYSNVPILFTGVMITGLVYFVIALKAMKYRKSVHHRMRGVAKPGNDKGNQDDDGKTALHSFRSNMKTLKFFCIVFGLLVVCGFPYLFIEFTSEFISTPDSIYRASTALGFLNSGINVLVYPLYNKRFRKAMRQMVCPCCPYKQECHDLEGSTTAKGKTTGPTSTEGTTRTPVQTPPEPVLGTFAPQPPKSTLGASASASASASGAVFELAAVLFGTGSQERSTDPGHQKIEDVVDKTKLQAAPSSKTGLVPQKQSLTPAGPEKAASQSTGMDSNGHLCPLIPVDKRPSADWPGLPSEKPSSTISYPSSISTSTSTGTSTSTSRQTSTIKHAQ